MATTFFGVSLEPARKSFILPRAFEVLAESDVVYLMTAEDTRTHTLVRELIGEDKTIRLFRPRARAGASGAATRFMPRSPRRFTATSPRVRTSR